MKVFLKSCSLYEVKRSVDYGLIDGVYLASENDDLCVATDSDISSIIKSVPGPVFMSVSGGSVEDILEKSLQTVRFGPNISIKIKVSLEALKAAKILQERDVSVNLTGITSMSQLVLAAKSGVGFISFDVADMVPKHESVHNFLTDIVKLCRQGQSLSRVALVADTDERPDLLDYILRSGLSAVALNYEMLMGIMADR